MNDQSELHAFVVFTDPKEADEEQFNRWYDEEHLQEILEVPGVVSVRRFRLGDASLGGYETPVLARYMAVYMIEGDAQAALDEIRSRIDSGLIVPSTTVDPESIKTWVFTALGEELKEG